MKSIEEIKTELVLKMLQGFLSSSVIGFLPKDDELRTFICQFELRYAYWYALLVDREPSGETRTVVCKDPSWAYAYAHNVDKAPSEETRIAACKDPYWAYCYAVYVDKGPHPHTRTSACKKPNWAYAYAYNIDKAPSDETRIAVSKELYDACRYQEWEREYYEKY